MTDTRRSFIKKSAFAIGGTGLIGTAASASYNVLNNVAPSDTINVALIGCNFMGIPVLQQHLAIPGVKCVALCDIDNKLLEEKAKVIQEKYDQKPLLYNDFREMLENKDIDAVIVSTPDHWHCLAMVYACQAGKDVYVEKPMANTIEECNVMVQAAKKYNRVVQVGQQQRSGDQWQTIIKKVKSGDLGKLRKVEVWSNFDYGIGQKMAPDEPVPDGVDYDMWLGPAPAQKTFNPNRFHGYWRMFWDYGGGLMTDWGVHLLDMALMAGDITAAPKQIMAYGDNLSFKDHARDTYDTMSVIYPQENYVITYEQTAGTQNGPYDMNYGLRFVCDDASIVASRAGYKILPEYDEESKSDKAEKYVLEKYREDHDLHAKNFISCIKDRSETICPPEAGRQVAMYAHMANIAVRSGENSLIWDDAQNKFLNSEKANSFIVPEYRAPWELPKL